MFMLGPKILNHDLRGGSTIRVVFDEPPVDGREGVLAALPTDYEVNGELIEFAVSKLRSEEFTDRVFKIDSNLPVYDGEGDAPYDELDDVLERVFEGKLSLLHVDVSETTSSAPVNPANEVGMKFPQLQDIVSMMNLTRPMVLLTPQEEEAPAETNQENETSETGSPETETNNENQESSDESSFEVGDSTQASEDDGLSSEQPAAQPSGLTQVTTKTDLEFKFEISGKALKTLLLDASRVEDIPVEETQIVLTSPDGNPGESMSGVMSKKWTVELKVPKKDDASTILNNWASTYNQKPYFPTISGVGGQIARETQFQALAAIIASLLGIIAYVWIRFQNVAFGLAAVAALIHDVLVVLGAIAVSHFVADYLGILGIEKFKISLPIVAALLTIIGYSLNDTIVVFDRIREVRGKRLELTADIINTSISQTLSRTVLTSLTTFIVVFILYWFGGDAIHGFAFSLVIGVIVGTYSSIFVASPVLLWLMNRVGLSPGDPAADDNLATE